MEPRASHVLGQQLGKYSDIDPSPQSGSDQGFRGAERFGGEERKGSTKHGQDEAALARVEWPVFAQQTGKSKVAGLDFRWETGGWREINYSWGIALVLT